MRVVLIFLPSFYFVRGSSFKWRKGKRSGEAVIQFEECGGLLLRVGHRGNYLRSRGGPCPRNHPRLCNEYPLVSVLPIGFVYTLGFRVWENEFFDTLS